jgi:3D (Asp-Asp-Asp) domain-containing protein
MKNLIRFAMALVAAHMAAPLWAAAPPGPYFNGFENNTNGWFDRTNGWFGTITRRPSFYSTGPSGYASGIPSASGNWHARVTGNDTPCDQRQYGTPCYGPKTNWGGYSSTFPQGGYSTQVDIYLDVAWAAAHPDYRFDWDSAINDSSGNFLRDFVFNAGTNPAGVPGGFFVNASTNGNRSGAFPENPCPSPSTPPNSCRTPVFIDQSGWYTFRHTFRNNAGSLAVDFDIINQSTNVPVPGAHWTIYSGDAMSMVGGNRYGWFVIEEIPDLAIDNSLRTGVCHSGDGDGDVEERDSHKMHHQHFHKNSTCGDQGGGEEDNVNSDDEDSGSHFESNSVQSSTFTADEDSQAVTMIGTGTHDGLPVGFTMIAVDNGNLAPGVFTLILTDGYAFTGDLTSGTIAIH